MSHSMRAFIGVAILVASTLASCTSISFMSTDDTTLSKDEKDFYTDLNELHPIPLGEEESLRVVVTTSILADVVSNVGGEAIDLDTLIPLNTDPHSYEPVPTDLRTVSQAHIVFANGLGLEVFLKELLKNAGVDVPVVSLSEGVNGIEFGDIEQEGHEGASIEHQDERVDPHVWFDPHNVLVWVDNIVDAFASLDPANIKIYEANAKEYRHQLDALDAWIVERIDVLPQEKRQLVTDHRIFGYFARRYGFEMVGAVVPVYSSAAEPSAQEIAQLEERITNLGVKAIFVGMAVNPNLAARIAEDTGVKLVRLYTGSLSDREGPAGTYIDFMRYNVNSIVEGLS